MGAMEASDDASRLGQLIGMCSKRGFRRLPPIALVLMGLIPALILTEGRVPGQQELPLIGFIFVLGPALLLVRWTMRDRSGQGARELVMWLRVLSRSESQIPPKVNSALKQLSAEPTPFDETALDVRDALAPLVASPGTLSVRITIYRFWYAVLWAVLGTLLVVAYAVLLASAPG